MEILKKLTENNFNEVAKLIENNSIPEQLMTGNIKNQLRRYRHSYSTPAQIELAKKHKKAAKYGFRLPHKGTEDQVCGCCNMRLYNEDIPLCQKVQIQQKKKNDFNSINQYKFTSDAALFLTFIKSTIILTLINSIIHSIFNLLTSQLFGKQCKSLKYCPSDLWNTLSMSNKYKQDNWIMIVDILNLVGIVVSILFLVYNRRRQDKLSALIDLQSQSQAHYTILVSNIPVLQFPKKGQQGKKSERLQFFYRKHLEEYFNNLITQWISHKGQWTKNKDTLGLQIEQMMNKNDGQLRSEEVVKTVSLCYDLSRLQTLQDIKGSMVNTFENSHDQDTSLLLNQNGQPLYSERFASIPERVNFLNDCELIINGQYARDNSFLFSVTHFVGHALISFQYQHYKGYIQRLFFKNNQALKYNGQYLQIEDACHPTDVYWQNMRFSQTKRNKKSFTSCMILTLILFFSFMVLLFLQILKQNNSKTQQGDFINITKSYSITLVIVLVIMVLNYGFDFLARILTEQQKRKTRTDFVLSVLIKSFVTKLINTVMLYFFVALLFKSQAEDTQLMGPVSLIFQITAFIFISGILHLIKTLIYPHQLYLRFLRWWRYRKNQNSVENKFQISLNKQFEYPEFDFAEKYTYYLVTLYTAFFYSYLVPVGVPLILVILFLQYWADKITLLRRSSKKYTYGYKIAHQVTQLFQSSILILALGNLIFSYYIHNYTVTIINLVGLLIAVVFVLLVWFSPSKLESLIFGQYQYNQKYIYDDCLQDGKFQSTYWTQNPATFLIQEQKVTGKKRPKNPALNRKSVEGGVFLSSFNE